MIRLFIALSSLLIVLWIPTAQAGQPQPDNHEAETWTVSSQTPTPDHQEKQLNLFSVVGGTSLLFLGTLLLFKSRKNEASSMLYLANIYLSQKDALWKS